MPGLTLMRKEGELDKKVCRFDVPKDPEGAGLEIRNIFDLLRPVVVPKVHSLVADCEADFGQYYATKYITCDYVGDGAHWYHRCKIDPTKDAKGVATKGPGTPGFIWPHYARFVNFQLSAPCAYSAQDGGIGGYSGDTTVYPGYESFIEFVNCRTDARNNADWGLAYGWYPYFNRTVNIIGGEHDYCRFLLAAAHSNKPLWWINIDGATFRGDANTSKSRGHTSGGDSTTKLPDGTIVKNWDAHITGGVMAAVLCRAGYVHIKNSKFGATGLKQEYYDTRPGADWQRWTCSRVAVIGTDMYDANPAKTEWIIENCDVLYEDPGISRVWSHVDLRGTHAKATLKVISDAEAVRADNARKMRSVQQEVTQVSKEASEAIAAARAKYERTAEENAAALKAAESGTGKLKLWTPADDPVRPVPVAE